MIDIDINKIDAATDSLQELETEVKRLSRSIVSAFSESPLASFLDRTKTVSVRLDKELLVLRLAFGKLRAAIGQAAAPLGAVFIPMLTKAVYAATRFVRYIGEIIATLMGVTTVSKVTEKAVSSLYGSLAEFDQIDRLKGTSGVIQTVREEAIELDLWQKLIVSKIQTLIKPLQQLDFSKTIAAFGKLKEAIAPLARTLFEGLEWAWYNLLVPLADWAVSTFIPNFLEMLAEALTTLNGRIIDAKPYLQWLLQNSLLPIQQWTAEKAIKSLGFLGEGLDAMSLWMGDNQGLIQNMTGVVAAFMEVWTLGKLSSFGLEASNLSAILQTLGISATGVLGVFPQFGELFSSLGTTFKTGANSLIGATNGMLSGLSTGMNTMVNALNKLNFTIPDWVPIFGGNTFGLNLKTVTAPQIPYLAQGAVLPANKPFLAMVGDQRHGTNVEAPLATIQEAVAVTMQSQQDAILAGFAASIEVQREILEAVLGIQLGDSVIGQAVSRYQQKMAVIQGV